jgi:hypothetical protein
MSSWALWELLGAELGDARLNERLVRLAEQLSERPEASIPQACGSSAATKAAYRFWDNDAVSPAGILQPHRRRTIERACRLPVTLAVQDTTEVNLTAHGATDGLGYLSRRHAHGLLVHHVLCVAADGAPLGLLEQTVWARPPEDLGKRRTRDSRLTRQKESQRWLDGLAAVQRHLAHAPCVVVVGDRESDLYDLLAAPRAAHVHLLVRTRDRRRCVVGPHKHLGDAVSASPPRAETTLTVPRADDRPPRQARLTVRWTPLTIRRPANHPDGAAPASVPLTFVEAREEAPPPGAAALCWLLATTLEVTTVEQALAVLQWYAYRWRIERFHYVLKSGCRLEQHQLASRDRWERLIATLSIVAWRILHLIYEARREPQASCTRVFSVDQWQVLHLAVHPREPLPQAPPSLDQALRDCARLGGYLGRTRDGPPGVKTLWRGWRRLADLVEGYRIARNNEHDSTDDYG